LANNPELAASRHDVEAAEAQRDAAFGAMWPSIGLVGGYTRHLDDQRLVQARYNGEPGVFSDDTFLADAMLTMPLFTGGRLISDIKVAELLARSASHRLARTQGELVFNVSSVFYGVLAQRRVIESLEFSKNTLQEHLKRVRDLITAQKAAAVDQLRTEVRIADLEQRLASERNVLAIQTHLLTNLLGLARAGQPLEPEGELSGTPGNPPQIAAALDLAFGRRPDYLAARAALEAQAKAVDAAQAGHWPTVSLQAAYGRRWAGHPTTQPAGSSREEDVGRIGVLVDIPIFEGGRIAARVRQERAKLRAAQERLRRLELQIQLDVETAILNLGSAAERVRATEKAIEQAKESLRIEREKYELGKGAIVDVLDAQASLLDAQTSYYRALADQDIAVTQLKLATGEP
jgi:outer membrane protein TolC